MLHKLKQQTQRFRFTSSDRLPNRRARRFLLNYLRFVRAGTASYRLRGAMGLIQWLVASSYRGESRIAFRSGCFITGRARGTSQRFTISRTKVKFLADQGKLFGARKSS